MFVFCSCSIVLRLVWSCERSCDDRYSESVSDTGNLSAHFGKSPNSWIVLNWLVDCSRVYGEQIVTSSCFSGTAVLWFRQTKLLRATLGKKTITSIPVLWQRWPGRTWYSSENRTVVYLSYFVRRVYCRHSVERLARGLFNRCILM